MGSELKSRIIGSMTPLFAVTAQRSPAGEVVARYDAVDLRAIARRYRVRDLGAVAHPSSRDELAACVELLGR